MRTSTAIKQNAYSISQSATTADAADLELALQYQDGTAPDQDGEGWLS